MKKLILKISVVTVLVISSFTYLNASSQLNTLSQVSKDENIECKYGQCQATAKSTGKRCRHCVSNTGDITCWQH